MKLTLVIVYCVEYFPASFIITNGRSVAQQYSSTNQQSMPRYTAYTIETCKGNIYIESEKERARERERVRKGGGG